jgi:hypothetical protein
MLGKPTIPYKPKIQQSNTILHANKKRLKNDCEAKEGVTMHKVIIISEKDFAAKREWLKGCSRTKLCKDCPLCVKGRCTRQGYPGKLVKG